MVRGANSFGYFLMYAGIMKTLLLKREEKNAYGGENCREAPGRGRRVIRKGQKGARVVFRRYSVSPASNPVWTAWTMVDASMQSPTLMTSESRVNEPVAFTFQRLCSHSNDNGIGFQFP